jgi:hypothetical protein
MIAIKNYAIEQGYTNAKSTGGCYILLNYSGTNILHTAPSSDVAKTLYCTEFFM